LGKALTHITLSHYQIALAEKEHVPVRAHESGKGAHVAVFAFNLRRDRVCPEPLISPLMRNDFPKRDGSKPLRSARVTHSLSDTAWTMTIPGANYWKASIHVGKRSIWLKAATAGFLASAWLKFPNHDTPKVKFPQHP
jgi:hypothetical protein